MNNQQIVKMIESSQYCELLMTSPLKAWPAPLIKKKKIFLNSRI